MKKMKESGEDEESLRLAQQLFELEKKHVQVYLFSISEQYWYFRANIIYPTIDWIARRNVGESFVPNGWGWIEAPTTISKDIGKWFGFGQEVRM